MRNRILQLLLLTLVTAGQAAVAAPKTVEESVRLTFPANASAESIYRALGRKSRLVCHSRAIVAHRMLAEQAECRRDFVRDAVAAIDRPALTALHLERVTDDDTMFATRAEARTPE